MSHFKTWCKFWTWHQGRSKWVVVLIILAGYLILSAIVRTLVPPPAAVSMFGPQRATDSVSFLVDDSWIAEDGQRLLSQHIFDDVLHMIGDAERFILLDMFLFNDWQGPVAENHRRLSSELTQALIVQKRAFPHMEIIVVSDPINTVYGGLPSSHLDAMSSAGIHTVLTRLDRLQDSNPLWSGFWRVALAPFGNSPGTLLPNPFGEGRVSLRSYFSLLNFKANHRKLLIADGRGKALQGLVSSANPHDGSSAHRNVALRFGGEAVYDLLAGEQALLSMNEAAGTVLASVNDELTAGSSVAVKDSGESAEVPKPEILDTAQASIQVLSESRIHDAVIELLQSSKNGDAIDLAMFYLSERGIVKALKAASVRGANIRVLLDVNNDAFGRAKNGVPNRPVAAELVKAGITVRWCATKGEQCHAKWLHASINGQHDYLLGSANYTRRNLMDLNMETNIRLRVSGDSAMATEMADFFEHQWRNTESRLFSEPYERYANDSMLLTLQYRFMEATGLSTF